MNWIDERIGSLGLMITQENRAIGLQFGNAETLQIYTQELNILTGLKNELSISRAMMTPEQEMALSNLLADRNTSVKVRPPVAGATIFSIDQPQSDTHHTLTYDPFSGRAIIIGIGPGFITLIRLICILIVWN